MKKSVLLFVSAVLSAASAMAQVAKPEVNWIPATDDLYGVDGAQSFDSLAINSEGSGKNLYLYNVEANLFLTGGNNWGTRACMSRDGSNVRTYSDLLNFKTNVEGYKWELISDTTRAKDGVKKDPNDLMSQYYRLANKTTSNYLSADTGDGHADIWVDGDNNRPTNGWYFSGLQPNGTFKMGYVKPGTKEEGEGEDKHTVTTFTDMGFFGVHEFASGDLNTYVYAEAEKSACTTWAFVTEAEYARVQPLLKKYYAYLGFSQALEQAKQSFAESGVSYDWTTLDALLVGEYTYDEYKAGFDQLGPKLSLRQAIDSLKTLDPARDVDLFEEVFTESDDITEVNDITAVVNALITLKNALNEGVALDAAHDYSTYVAVYNSDESTVAQINEATGRVKAFVSLKKKLDESKAQYPALDFSNMESVYANPSSTNAQLSAAEKAMDDIIAEYRIDFATLDEPADVTAKVGYLDPASIQNGWGNAPQGWSRQYTGALQNGVFHINTWSGEGNSDGTNMTNPFIEMWVGGGPNLVDQMWYRDPSKQAFKLPAGAYKITAHIRLMQEGASGEVSDLSGGYIFGNSNRTSLTGENGAAVDGAAYIGKNYWKDGFEGYAIVGNDSTLKFGFMSENAKFSWCAAKNIHVYYMGKGLDALNFVRSNSELSIKQLDGTEIGTKALINAYVGYQDNYKAASDADAILEAYEKLNTLADSVKANIDAYDEYAKAVAAASTAITEEGLQGEKAEILVAYITGSAAPNETYPNGAYNYVYSERVLDTKGIQAEEEFVNNLLVEARRYSLKEGQDVTWLLTNPGFGVGTKNPNTTGWSGSQGLGGFKDEDGTCNYVVAEQYMGTVNFYQIVKDAPAGLYKIETQAFVRPAVNGNFDSSSTSTINTFLYMNQFRTKVPSILGDALPVADAIDHYNCFLTDTVRWFGVNDLKDATYTAETQLVGPGGKTVESAAGFYIPNSHPGAATAFKGGRYNTYTYGLVEDGEDMKIGVTSDGKGPAINANGGTVEGSWFLFSGFKLTFMGKNIDAIKEVLAVKAQELEEIVGDEAIAANMTNDVVDTGLDDLQTYKLSENVTNADQLYELLLIINQDIKDANQDLVDVALAKVVADSLQDAMDSLYTYKLTEALEMEVWQDAETIKGEYSTAKDDFFLDWDGEDEITVHSQWEDLIGRMREQKEKVLAAAAEAKASAASDDTPMDFTDYIVNPDCEQGGNSMTGWNFRLAKGNGPVKGSGGINGRSIEAWSGSVGKDLDFNVWQTIAALPEGTYTVSSAAANASNDVTSDQDAWAANPDAITGRVYFYTIVKDETGNETFYSTPVVPNVGSATDAQRYELTFKVAEGDTVTIGYANIGEPPFRWFMCDDFKLTFFGAASAKDESSDEGEYGEYVAIDAINAKATEQKNGKFLQNGSFVIYRNGKKYNVAGQRLK